MNEGDSAHLPPVPPEPLSPGSVMLKFDQIIPGVPYQELVPCYHFRIHTQASPNLGHINFRVGDTEHVRVCVGHIGFQIDEEFRGHGHALQACLAIAPFVRSIYDTETLTCDPDNHASLRTIERFGARFIDEVEVPAHDVHCKSGTRRKRRYRWSP